MHSVFDNIIFDTAGIARFCGMSVHVVWPAFRRWFGVADKRRAKLSATTLLTAYTDSERIRDLCDGEGRRRIAWLAKVSQVDGWASAAFLASVAKGAA